MRDRYKGVTMTPEEATAEVERLVATGRDMLRAHQESQRAHDDEATDS